MVMLGGHHIRANTEVHDVVFVAGHILEDTYPQLRQAWFGEQKGLHIDSWVKVNGVETEGKKYQIKLSSSKQDIEHEKLFLINLGGYSAEVFGELHRYILVVASDAKLAKQIGKKHFDIQWSKQHTDRVLEVDDCLAIDYVGECYIQLIEVDDYSSNVRENCYITIGIE